MKLLEIGQVLDIAHRIDAKKIIELGNDRIEGIAWLNNKFKEINNYLIKSQQGSMRLLNNPDLIKMADQFAEFYVVFMQNSEKFYVKAIEFLKNPKTSELPDDIHNDFMRVMSVINMRNWALDRPQQGALEFTQLELENLFDRVSTNMTPNMTKAIAQRTNKHYTFSIKNESLYGNL